MRTLMRWVRRFRSSAIAPVVFATVPLTYETAIPPGGHGELDTPALWVAPNPARSLLLVTDKTDDYIEIHDPIQNVYLGRLGGSGSTPGRLDRPNAVAVGYGIPTSAGPVDVLFVVERNNHRVTMFYLPYILYLGELGTADLEEPMGIALHWEGAQPQVWITDIGPTPQRILVYDVVQAPNGLAGNLARSFAAPASATLESIIIDPVAQRVLACDEGSQADVMVFDMQGTLLQRFGAGRFTDDPEGMAIFDLGNGTGYLIVTDQESVPMQFEVFDRQDYRWLRSFSGPTLGTDGIALLQQPLPNFTQGSFFAVHSDARVHAYSWADIAAATGLCVAGPCAPVDTGPLADPTAPRALVPNPFRPQAAITYRLSAPLTVRATVYDLRGAVVARLAGNRQGPGEHRLEWDGRSAGGTALPSGVYFLRLSIGTDEQTHKITLVR